MILLNESLSREDLEIKFRQGFLHGYIACMNGETNLDEVKKWANDDKDIPIAPPGSFYEGMVFDYVVLKKEKFDEDSYLREKTKEDFKKQFENE